MEHGTSSDDDDSLSAANLFQEPEGFYQPEKPASFTTYTLRDGHLLNLRLVGHSPLWVRLFTRSYLTFADGR